MDRNIKITLYHTFQVDVRWIWRSRVSEIMKLCECFAGVCRLYLQDRWHTHASIPESWIRRFWNLMFICAISFYLTATRSRWAVCAKKRSFQLSCTRGISILLQTANILYRQAEVRLGGLDDGSFTACSTAASNWKRELQVSAIAHVIELTWNFNKRQENNLLFFLHSMKSLKEKKDLEWRNSFSKN